MTDVRQAATLVLVALERGETTLATEIDRARASLADERDRALLVELCAGTVRWQRQLDAVIAQVSRRPVADLDAPVRAVLRLGAYQLLHLDRVPPHAIVHSAVETTRRLQQSRATGFVNGVLRGIQRTPVARLLPRRPRPEAPIEEQVRYLSITLSHPEWLVRRWLARVGFDACERWCQFNNASPTITLRVLAPATRDALLGALADAGIQAEPAHWVPDAIRLAPGQVRRVPVSLHDQFNVQDEGAQLVAHAVGVRPGDSCLDLCAAPGGKTTVLWSEMDGRGLLVAADHRPARVRLLASRLASLRVGAAIVALDATAELPFGAVFDRVVLDAPCSGLGTVRRDPDVKWRYQEADLARLAATQHVMIARAAAAVRPGGMLLYATCSSEPDENDAVVTRFLAERTDFRLAPIVFGPAIGPDADTRALLDDSGRLATRPDRDAPDGHQGLDAFFAAALVRSGSA